MSQAPEFIRSQLARFGIQEVFYLTHGTNLRSIGEHGILSHNLASGIVHEDISLSSAQGRRSEVWVKVHPDGPERPESVRCLHDMVPLFFNPRNPMSSKLRDYCDELALLVVDPSLMCDQDHLFAFSDGNLASPKSKQFCDFSRLDRLPWDVLRAGYWGDFEDGSRRRGAELLVWPSVPAQSVTRIEVTNPAARYRAIEAMGESIAPTKVTVDRHSLVW